MQQKLRNEKGETFRMALHAQHLMDSCLKHPICTETVISEKFYGWFVCSAAEYRWGESLLHRIIPTLNETESWMVRYPSRSGRIIEGTKYTSTSDFRTVLQWMIDAEVDVDSKEPITGRTPLMALLTEFGCSMQQDDTVLADCVSILVDAGASLSVCDSLGNTAMHYAAALGLSPAVKMLIVSQPNLHMKRNKSKLTPKDAASQSWSLEKASNNPRGAEMTARLYESFAMLALWETF